MGQKNRQLPNLRLVRTHGKKKQSNTQVWSHFQEASDLQW